jgi:hypothetical protein
VFVDIVEKISTNEVEFVFVVGMNLSDRNPGPRMGALVEKCLKELSLEFFLNDDKPYDPDRTEHRYLVFGDFLYLFIILVAFFFFVVMFISLLICSLHAVVHARRQPSFGFQPPHVPIFQLPNVQSESELVYVMDSIARQLAPIRECEANWRSHNNKSVANIENQHYDENDLGKEVNEAYRQYFAFWRQQIQPLIDNGAWFDVWPHVRFFFELRRLADCDGPSVKSLPVEVSAITLFYYMAVSSLAVVDWKRFI